MEEGTCIQYTWCILGRMPHSVQIAHHAPTRRYSFLRILWSSKHTIVKQFPFWKALAKSKDSAAWIKVKLSIAVEYMCVFFNFRHHWQPSWYYTPLATQAHTHTQYSCSLVSLSLSPSFSLYSHTPPLLFQLPLLWELKNNIDDEWEKPRSLCESDSFIFIVATSLHRQVLYIG